MSNILAILGATGQQGGSVLNFVLNDPELSQIYKIRAITRDVNSEKATKLKGKVEVVQGDINDPASLKAALVGVHTVFSVTTPSFGPNALEDEYNVGKSIADVAVENGAQYIIFSTLTAIKDISGGKYANVFPFDAKAKIEEYIRGLSIKSAFFAGASFMENFQSQFFLAPKQAADGTWVLARHVSPQSKFPLIDAVGDTGKFVGAILAEPDKYEGKTFCGAAGIYTMEQVAAILSKNTGKTIVYKQVSVKEFKEGIVGFGLPRVLADIFVDGFSFNEEFGYFGPNQEESIAWSVQNARGRPSTFEEYLEVHPFRLE
ncbi:hypothetical protein V499_05977 [Pseudogymnoascus sp. VKM F-103]|uniref:NmrA-like domain-containing protein n=1 Tax=Pseudogymnoascus verrucosus TaxID=342668 RepID=A0A1B8GBY2_9PEZI|nr:uncharacterized protein VE01_08452 [Pseudogymnoascus verrucosus]KFY73965.1 hypothetical protein V499_05977 [Pseudogymnoascus sp. VKM F-103]OBT93342.1 hypothetical protein VE01_08452 [Pseudogymnoascus verrucosus]